MVTTSAPAGLQALTRDRAVVRDAIGRVSSRESAMAAARGAQMTPAQAELILRGDQNALRLATRSLMDEPGSVLTHRQPEGDGRVDGRRHPGGPGPRREGRGTGGPARGDRRPGRSPALLGDRPSSPSTACCAASLSLPGRKLCLLVSDGFLVGKGTSEERTGLLRQVTDAATRSGAVVYALDARGLAPAGADASVGGPVSDPGLRERVAKLAKEESRETLQRLARDTGGLLVRGTNDLGAGLGRMLADNEAFYLIAYEPTNTKRDGRFRKIELRLPRHPDFAVRTRAGYLAPDDRKPGAKAAPRATAGLPSLLAGPAGARRGRGPCGPGGARSPERRARARDRRLPRPPAGGAPGDRPGARGRRADCGGDRPSGRHRTDVEVLGGVYDASGNPVGLPFGRSFALDLGPAEYRRATEEGLRYAHRLPLDPGRYEVRIVAREPALAPLGRREPMAGGARPRREEADPEQPVRLRDAAAPPSGAGEGQETLRDAQLLRRFKRSDTLYFQLYVYNAVASENGSDRRRAPGPDPLGKGADRRLQAAAGDVPGRRTACRCRRATA